ncbi:hypothetical protein NQ176_g8103 [Zarea fungicola]|uniref:Uncharacterized protein n=1 Tax=Zarea fungicola TaxID=93591 RepID=A0ACC1MUF9_9HYPO|nr:hypothetical protein NQ176_g8103 [Lecanicillium fungicola]
MQPSSALLALTGGLSATALATPSFNCHEIFIPIDVSANNKNIPITLDLQLLTNISNLSQMIVKLDSSSVHGRFSIGARYCEPRKEVASRRNTLQILYHGITYTRDYWSGLAPPGTKSDQDRYSWIKFAAEQGYPTLSVDRLCNGLSSRPHGLIDCQLPLEVEAAHAIVNAARDGIVPMTGRSFAKIIHVGHSYGSILGNGLSVRYPNDVDAYILTGYSVNLAQGEPGVVLLPQYAPATLVSPQKYNAPLDPFYVEITNGAGARTVFYHGDYSKDILNYDLANTGTVTIGEVLTAQLGQLQSPDFQGPVFVLNGNEDGIFCEDGPIQALEGAPGNCSKNYSSNVMHAYPSAGKFGFYNTPNTGHCLHNHRTAQQSFKQAHDFLQAAGF